MGVRDLFWNIHGRDKSGPAWNSMKKNLNSVDGLAASVADRVGRIGRNMTRVGGIMTAASTPLLFAFRDSLKLYDQQAQAEARLAQGVRKRGDALGFTTQQLMEEAAALQDLTRFGDEQILGEVTGQLLTFGNISGEQFKRAQLAAIDVSSVLKKLGGDGADLQSVSIALGKALDDPVRGLTALSRMGITFSDAQKDMVKSLVASNQTLEAQDLILDEIVAKYGGQAEAAAQAGLGPIDQARNVWGDLKEDVGRTISTLLPPLVSFFRTVTDGFLGLPEPIRDFITIAGGVAIVIGPITLAVGLLTTALGGLGLAWKTALGPLGLIATAISLAGGLFAAFWPEVDKATSATDNLVLALGDEITQSQLLDQATSGNISMSVAVARQKLEEARTRHENVKAIIAEQRALALQSTEYSDLTSQIEDSKAALNSLGFPSNDVATFPNAEAFENEQQRLAGLLVERQRLLEANDEIADQLARTEENIQRLETGLESASGDVVTFGDALVTPIEPAERLDETLSRTATTISGLSGSSEDAKSGLLGLEGQLANVESTAESMGEAVSGSLKEMVKDFDASWDSIGDVVLSTADKILDQLLTQFFDPISQALTQMFTGLLSGGSSGGGLFGGIFGSIFSGIGSLFGAPKIGMATGGELGVRGRNGMDRNIARFRVSNDESIHVVKRGNTMGSGQVNVTIQTPDVESFKASRGQVARQLGRAVQSGQRFA